MKTTEYTVKYCQFYESWLDAETRQLHRENGPAVTSHDGKIRKYYNQGFLHRTNGPAVFNYGKEFYYLNGKEVSEEEVMGPRHPAFDCKNYEEYVNHMAQFKPAESEAQ